MIDWNKETNQNLLRIIGSSIKARRLQRNISAKELSGISGVSSASIARLETGTGNISLHNLLSILKALNMADELKLIFSAPEISPALLAKATSGKTQARVRKSMRVRSKDGKWVWGDDKDE